MNREVASEIRDEYIDTMSKIMFSYFKSYSGRLAKLQFEESASREDQRQQFLPPQDSCSSTGTLSQEGSCDSVPARKRVKRSPKEIAASKQLALVR